MSGAAPSPALQRFLLAVGQALRRGDVAAAMGISEQAVIAGLEEPNLLTLAAQGRMRLGKPEAALPILLRAREMAPSSIEALNALGLCLAQLGRGREGVQVFDAAIAVAPDTAYLQMHKAQTLEEIGDFTQAREVLDRMIAREPRDAAALARIAGLAARRGDWPATRDFANRALAVAPLAAATIALAMADLEDKQFDAARARLAPLFADARLSPVNRSIALGLTGDALDGQNKPDEAFAFYKASRETLRAASAPLFAGKESAVDRVRRIAAHYRAAPPAPAAAPDATSATGLAQTHVFLVGFPRSGTTLLEQVLASHPGIRTLEEADALHDAVRDFVDPLDGLDRFAALDAAGLSKYRDLYWRRVTEAGGRPDGAVFVDKMPLNAMHLGLIARLFPDARILFALRDPRDVVFSCFRRRLVMTAHMYEFTQLERAAAFYAAVMDLAQATRGDLAVLDARHEDLLEDFDGAARRVCAFLGVDWNAGMRDFAAHARTRDIKTPSSPQVVRGLEKDGAGTWRRYRKQLEPILPILAPWAARFGYKDA